MRGNPLRYRDPFGLTQRDIDLAWMLLRETQRDLLFPDAVPLPTIPLNIDLHGQYDPLVDLIELSARYSLELNEAGARDLLGTLIHELLHRNDPIVATPENNWNHDRIDKEEALRTQRLFERYQRVRTRQCIN